MKYFLIAGLSFAFLTSCDNKYNEHLPAIDLVEKSENVYSNETIDQKLLEDTFYELKITRIVDGDTFDAEVYVWPNQTIIERFRMLKINAPEKRGETKEKGIESKNYLESLIKNYELRVSITKEDSFGRMLGTLYRKTKAGWEDVNNKMIDDGYAVEFKK